MKRRARGTGSIVAHEGRWRWRYKGRSGYSATKLEAEQTLLVIRQLLDEEGPLTVRDFILQWHEERQLRVSYPEKEARALASHVLSYELFASKPLTKLRRPDCVRWLRWMEGRTSRYGKPLSKNTIRQAKNLLRRALEDAVDDGIIESNPMSGVRIRGGGEPRPHEWLRPDEVEAVLALELGTRQRAIISIAIFAGLSPKEIWGLRWGDIDLRSRTLHVRGKVKTSNRVRELPLIGPTAEALQAWKREQAAKLKKNREPVPLNGLTFPTPSGSSYRPDSDPASWREKRYRIKGEMRRRPSIPERAGVDRKVWFRELRHTFASNMVSGSWGPPVSLHHLAYLLGHGDVKATQIYAHLHPDGPIAAMRAAIKEPK